MISLLQILREISDSPKAIILAGSAGSGKTHIIKKVLGKLNSKTNIFILNNSSVKFVYLNPDDIIEKEKTSLGSAMPTFREKFEKTKQSKQNIIWDTTGANTQNTLSSLSNYDKFMVMVYTHPIVSILQNIKRDRKLPLEAVVLTWNQVYNNINEYKKQLKNNFILIQNIIPGYEQQIKAFNKALEEGPKSLKQYLINLVQQNPEEFKSSFKQTYNFEDLKIEKEFNEILSKTSYNKEEDNIYLDNLKKEFDKEYKNTNSYPDINFLEKKLNSFRNNENKRQIKYDEDLEDIVKKLTSSEFKKLISQKESLDKLTQWVNS
jgi:Cdc6-like AAA superfamily ATPase